MSNLWDALAAISGAAYLWTVGAGRGNINLLLIGLLLLILAEVTRDREDKS